MADQHEMRRIDGKIVAVYTDPVAGEYRIVNCERVYLSVVCPACGGDPMLCECQTAESVDVPQYGE